MAKPRSAMAYLDRLLQHPWMARAGAFGTISFVVGAIVWVVHGIGHVLKHASALTIVSDVLMVVGVALLVVVGLLLRAANKHDDGQIVVAATAPRIGRFSGVGLPMVLKSTTPTPQPKDPRPAVIEQQRQLAAQAAASLAKHAAAQKALAQRLADLYNAGHALWVRLFGPLTQLTSSMEGMSGAARGAQLAREKQVREWDDAVEDALSGDAKVRWRTDRAVPAWHSSAALIKPAMDRDGLKDYLVAKLAILQAIIVGFDE